MKCLVLFTFFVALCAMAYARWDAHIYWDPIQGRYVQDQGRSMDMTEPSRGFPYPGLLGQQGQLQRPVVYVLVPYGIPQGYNPPPYRQMIQ